MSQISEVFWQCFFFKTKTMLKTALLNVIIVDYLYRNEFIRVVCFIQ